MLPRNRAYRLPVVLLIMTAAFSLPLAPTTANADEPYMLSLDVDTIGSTTTISGEVDTGGATGLTVEFTGVVTGTANVDSSGNYSMSATFVLGSGDAVLKNSNGDELDFYTYDVI